MGRARDAAARDMRERMRRSTAEADLAKSLCRLAGNDPDAETEGRLYGRAVRVRAWTQHLRRAREILAAQGYPKAEELVG